MARSGISVETELPRDSRAQPGIADDETGEDSLAIPKRCGWRDRHLYGSSPKRGGWNGSLSLGLPKNGQQSEQQPATTMAKREITSEP